MNIKNLENEIKFANELGLTLNIDERLRLTLAHLKLNDIEKFDQILFWGKIYGISSDYYIIEGLRFRSLKQFPQKTFYFCNEDFLFSEVPKCKLEQKQFLESLQTPFSGQREKILKENQKTETFMINGEEYVLPNERITELDRLSFLINEVENNCQLVPKGALKLTPTNEIRYDETFFGLTIQTGNLLENYQHFREPVERSSKEKIERGEALMQNDFLDCIKQDLPKDCWSLQTDSYKSIINIRSLLWPGYVGYHRVNSEVFGGFYIGEGIKNIDFPFII